MGGGKASCGRRRRRMPRSRGGVSRSRWLRKPREARKGRAGREAHRPSPNPAPRRVPRPDHLNSHVRQVHSTERPFKCEVGSPPPPVLVFIGFDPHGSCLSSASQTPFFSSLLFAFSLHCLIPPPRLHHLTPIPYSSHSPKALTPLVLLPAPHSLKL